mmetsp:Transcript_54067/g.175739  ORF Transcript_54067/g.175739 Transcript_54067/m.175739 type:complete len:494 (-) Transcript_54067:303-1784(-)
MAVFHAFGHPRGPPQPRFDVGSWQRYGGGLARQFSCVGLNLIAIPDSFVCSITRSPMVDPVMTNDGHVYDREQIQRWINQRATSPNTGLALSSRFLMPVILLKELVEAYMNARPEVSGVQDTILTLQAESDSLLDHMHEEEARHREQIAREQSQHRDTWSTLGAKVNGLEEERAALAGTLQAERDSLIDRIDHLHEQEACHREQIAVEQSRRMSTEITLGAKISGLEEEKAALDAVRAELEAKIEGLEAEKTALTVAQERSDGCLVEEKALHRATRAALEAKSQRLEQESASLSQQLQENVKAHAMEVERLAVSRQCLATSKREQDQCRKELQNLHLYLVENKCQGWEALLPSILSDKIVDSATRLQAHIRGAQCRKRLTKERRQQAKMQRKLQRKQEKEDKKRAALMVEIEEARRQWSLVAPALPAWAPKFPAPLLNKSTKYDFVRRSMTAEEKREWGFLHASKKERRRSMTAEEKWQTGFYARAKKSGAVA